MTNGVERLRAYVDTITSAIPPARSRVAVLRVIGQIVNGPIELQRDSPPANGALIPQFGEETNLRLQPDRAD